MDHWEEGVEGLRKPSAWGSLTVNIEPLMNALDWLKDPNKERPVTFPKATPGGGNSAHPTPALGKGIPASVAWGGAALNEEEIAVCQKGRIGGKHFDSRERKEDAELIRDGTGPLET